VGGFSAARGSACPNLDDPALRALSNLPLDVEHGFARPYGGFAAFRNFETSNRLVKSGRSHMTAAVPYYRRYGLSDT